MMPAALISVLDSKTAARLVVAEHYLHRRPPISHAFGIHVRRQAARGRHLRHAGLAPPCRWSACPSDPSKVIELNRLWLDDELPRNSESWFVSRTLKMLPPRIVVSYADPLFGHYGYIYRALNFHYAGWTDMERKTPRYDYIPLDPTTAHPRGVPFGYAYKRRRVAKVKYWITTGKCPELDVAAWLAEVDAKAKARGFDPATNSYTNHGRTA
jgi:hypothetical protein